jgi:hypothetical protein
MPDPNSHAGLTPLVKHEPMPLLWWLTPWTFAVQQWNARAKLYAQCQDLRDDLATARQDAANFSDHAVYHEQRHADQSHELNALNEIKLDLEICEKRKKAAEDMIDEIYEIVPARVYGGRKLIEEIKRLANRDKAKRKPAPKAKAAKKAKR